MTPLTASENCSFTLHRARREAAILAIVAGLNVASGCAQAQQLATETVAPAPMITTYNIPDPDAIKPTRSVVYKITTDSKGEKVELRLDIFEPPGHNAGDVTPVIVLFFGGGWNGGSPPAFYPQSAYFASRGMVAIAPDYRTKSGQGTSPYDAVTDGKSAIRWVRAHARELGIDPNRVAAGGGSAGGHLAASAGIVPGLDEPKEDASVSSVPNALVLWFPVIDTSEKGYGHGRLGERWKEISPADHVRPGLPPTIIFHGTADKVVPYQNEVDFTKAMKEAGNRSELVTIEGAGHGFARLLQTKAANTALRQADIFLQSLGYLSGEPTLPPPAR